MASSSSSSSAGRAAASAAAAAEEGPSAGVEGLGVVRPALRLDDANFGGASDDEHRECLKMLEKIVRNLHKSSDEKYRRLSATNKKLHDRVLRWPGAVTVLQFVGFQLAADGSKYVLTGPENRTKFDRVAGIIHSSIPAVVEKPVPVEPDMRVFRAAAKTPSSSSASASPAVGGGGSGDHKEDAEAKEEEEEDEVVDRRADNALLARAYQDEQRRLQMASRFTTPEEREAERLRNVPKFDRCVLRVEFKADAAVVQANFHPLDPLRKAVAFFEPLLREGQGPLQLKVPPREVLRDAKHYDQTLRELRLVPGGRLICFQHLNPETLALAQADAPSRLPNVRERPDGGQADEKRRKMTKEEAIARIKENQEKKKKKKKGLSKEEAEQRMAARMKKFGFE